MTDSDLSIFDDEPAAQEPQEVPEATPTEQEPEAAKAAQEPEPAQSETGEPEAAPPVADPKEERHAVPIAAHLDERERRQAAERQAAEVTRKLEELQRQIQSQQAQQKAPDWFEDPQAAALHQQQTFQQAMQAQTIRTSQFFAEREFGADLVNEALSFFDENPQLSQQFLSHPSPIHAAVEFYKKQQVLSEIGSDPEAWRKSQEEALRQKIMAELQAQQPAPTPTARPPASIAKAPSGGVSNETAVNVPPSLNGLFNG